MRIPFLISIQSVLLAVSALHLNETLSIVTEKGLIPLSHVYCHDEDLPREYEIARDILVKKVEEARIEPGWYVQVYVPDIHTFDGVSLTVCNHKRGHDSIDRVEIDQVLAVITEECGKGKSGRVQSRKWLKQWVFLPQRYQKYQELLQPGWSCACPHSWPCWKDWRPPVTTFAADEAAPTLDV